jgi:hypothetical protein
MRARIDAKKDGGKASPRLRLRVAREEIDEADPEPAVESGRRSRVR